AAATYTISDAFQQATGAPMALTSAIIAVLLFITVFGGIKRISSVASAIVPFMTIVYMALVIVVLALNITRVPAVFSSIFSAAFGLNAIFGASIGTAIQQGVKRGTFSSASGMG